MLSTFIADLHLLFSQLIFLLSTGPQPYLLFADSNFGFIGRASLNGSDFQALVVGLASPIALDFDYRYNGMTVCMLLTLQINVQLCLNCMML